MKTNLTKPSVKVSLYYAPLSLLAGGCTLLGGQPAQAQIISHRIVQPSPEAQDATRQGYLLAKSAAAFLHAGRYAQAEAEAREAISVASPNGVGEEVLAAALLGQDKDQEALQQYQKVVEHYDGNPRNLLPYALLLLKSGQWGQALDTYNQAASQFSHGSLRPVETRFSPGVPEPAALAVAIHIERGRLYNAGTNWAGESQDVEAMFEYAKALRLAPDNALANYYYGIGWQKLSPAERAKLGTAGQAKAALQKAVKIGTGAVKKAALKALRVARNTK